MLCALLMLGCDGGGGSGGGGDDADDGMWDGGSGTGADNAVTFWRYYGELEAGDYGHNSALAVTSDGGFLAAGMKATDFSAETRDYFLLKTDAQGNEQWRLTGSEPGEQNLNDIRQTKDGGAVAVGYTGEGSERDILVVKTDANGNLQWAETYDAGASAFDEGHAVSVLSDGYAVAGGGSHDVSTGDAPFVVDDLWFFKINADGTKAAGSGRFFSMAGWSRAYAMEKTRDSGFILTGIGPPDSVFVARLDQNGDEIWSGLYGTGIGYAVCQLPAPDNGFVVAGATPPFAEEASDLLVVKIDEDGNVLWQKVFGGSDLEIGHGVAVYPSGELVVLGQTRSFSSASSQWGRDDFHMIKLDQDGEVLWQKVKGISPDNGEVPFDVAAAADGGYIVAGQAQGQNILAKFDKNGDTIVLGDLDFTYTVGETTGLINMSNARQIAEVSGEFISLPIEIGSFPLDLLIDTLMGEPVTGFCSAGGTYEWNKPPAEPIAAGDNYKVAFTGCRTGPSEDQSIYNGTFTFDVDQVSGDITTDDYVIRIDIDPIDFVFTDDVGDSTISGGLTYQRTSTVGNLAERVETGGKNLTFSDDDSTETLTQMELDATRSEAEGFSLGNADQYAIFNTDLVTGPLTVTVKDPVAGDEVDAPDSGRLLVKAQDGSSLIMTFNAGIVTIEVDTDDDGVIDGTLTADWMDID
jgi:hypothetical protein